MALFLCWLSIVLAYFSPTEIIPSLAPFHVQMVILLFGLVAAFATLSMRPANGLQSPQYILLLGLWAAIIGSHVVQLKFRYALDALSGFGPLVAIYVLVQLTSSSLRRIRILAALLILIGVIQATEAILAYHTGFLGAKLLLMPPDSLMAATSNRVRGFGFLSDPNDFGQFLLVALSLLGVFWKRGRSTLNVILFAPPAMILIYATYLTFSRGAMLGLGAVLFFALYRANNRLPAVLVTGLGMAILTLMKFTGGREIAVDGTTAGRLISWGAGITSTIRHPLFGIGFGRFTDINDLTAHNSFVLCVTELGLIGYFFWLGLLIVTLTGLARLTRLPVKSEEDESYSATVFAMRTAFAAFITTAWFLSRTYTETLYILLALAASLYQLRSAELPAEFKRMSWLLPRTLKWEFATMLLVYIFVRARLIS